MATSVAATGASQSIQLLPNRPTTAFPSPVHVSASQHFKAALPSTRLFLSPQSSLLSLRKPYLIKIKASASPIPLSDSSTKSSNLLSDSTRTISSLFASGIVLSKVLLKAVESISLKIQSVTPNPTPEEVVQIRGLKDSLVWSVGPMFFAALRRSGSPKIADTPMTLVAGAMVKWLDIYAGIMMIRVLLSWFPNMPWERQPLSAIRDLCDPYLNLFRGIIPPLFNTMDVSPLFAFASLGVLSAFLNNTRVAAA